MAAANQVGGNQAGGQVAQPLGLRGRLESLWKNHKVLVITAAVFGGALIVAGAVGLAILTAPVTLPTITALGLTFVIASSDLIGSIAIGAVLVLPAVACISAKYFPRKNQSAPPAPPAQPALVQPAQVPAAQPAPVPVLAPAAQPSAVSADVVVSRKATIAKAKEIINFEYAFVKYPENVYSTDNYLTLIKNLNAVVKQMEDQVNSNDVVNFDNLLSADLLERLTKDITFLDTESKRLNVAYQSNELEFNEAHAQLQGRIVSNEGEQSQ